MFDCIPLQRSPVWTSLRAECRRELRQMARARSGLNTGLVLQRAAISLVLELRSFWRKERVDTTTMMLVPSRDALRASDHDSNSLMVDVPRCNASAVGKVSEKGR